MLSDLNCHGTRSINYQILDITGFDTVAWVTVGSYTMFVHVLYILYKHIPAPIYTKHLGDIWISVAKIGDEICNKQSEHVSIHSSNQNNCLCFAKTILSCGTTSQFTLLRQKLENSLSLTVIVITPLP